MSKVEQFSPYKRKGYSQTEQTQIRKAFRRKHGCCNCLNEWDFDSCMEMGICRYDPKPEPAYLRTKDRKPCARNGGKLCPYENGSGTCFGFCIKEILKEHKEKKARLQEQEAGAYEELYHETGNENYNVPYKVDTISYRDYLKY